MDTLHIQLYSHDEYKKGEATSLIFEILNPTDKPIRILKWNTPLEGLRSDCFDIKRNGKPVPYHGIMVKRAAPTEDDFLTILPGKSVTNKVDLSVAYDMSSPGHVKVDYKKDGLCVLTEDTKANNATSSVRIAASISFKPSREIKLVTKKADFRISGGTKKKLPLGAQVRVSQAANPKITPSKKANAVVTGP